MWNKKVLNLVITRQSSQNPIYEFQFISQTRSASIEAAIIFISFLSRPIVNYKFDGMWEYVRISYAWVGSQNGENIFKLRGMCHNYESFIFMSNASTRWHYLWILPQSRRRRKSSNTKYCIFERKKNELCFHLNNPVHTAEKRNLCKNVIYKIRMQ